MNYRFAVLAFSLCVWVGQVRLVAKETPPPVRLMPLGDSTTAGSVGAGQDGTGGYRRVLAGLWTEAKEPLDFVGSLNDPAGAEFDADHEGHRAWRIDQVSAQVADWLRKARPDIVLVQLGINDLIQGATPAEAADRYSRLLAQCQAGRPEAQFYCAAILPVRDNNDYHVPTQAVRDFNRRLPAIVAEHAKRGLRVVFTDLPATCAWADADFSPDGLHPSARGYRKIGVAWFNRLHASGSAHLP